MSVTQRLSEGLASSFLKLENTSPNRRPAPRNDVIGSCQQLLAGGLTRLDPPSRDSIAADVGGGRRRGGQGGCFGDSSLFVWTFPNSLFLSKVS